MPDQSPCPCRLVVADRARFSIVSHMCTEEEIRKTVDAYLLKYYGKPSPTTLASTGTVSKWQAQAQMLSCALPIDVVHRVSSVCTFAAGSGCATAAEVRARSCSPGPLC